MRIIFAAVLALSLPACLGPGEITGVGGEDGTGEGDGTGGGTGGGGGSGSGSGAPGTPRIQATADKTTVTTELGKTETMTLTIQSMDGFAGPVPITASVTDGAAALTGFNVTATPASVDLTAGGSATVQVQVQIPTDPSSLAPKLEVDLGGTSPMNLTTDVTIANRLMIMIAAGTGTGGTHGGLPAANSPIRVRSGAQLVFMNQDSIQHVIHGNGGIPHEDLGAGMPNTEYMVTVNADATWYCHSHEGASGINRPVRVQ